MKIHYKFFGCSPVAGYSLQKYLMVVLVQFISEILGESYAPIQCMLMIQILVFIVFPRIEIV
jgi:hypothetical protein